MKHKCEDCKHCDMEAMKCHPQSKDCHAEYDLTKEDLKIPDRCDFFEPTDLNRAKRRNYDSSNSN